MTISAVVTETPISVSVSATGGTVVSVTASAAGTVPVTITGGEGPQGPQGATGPAGPTSWTSITDKPTTDGITEGSTNLYHTTVRAAAAAPVQSVAGRTGTVSLVKGDVGLGNVDNTSDANKPISTATQTALAGKVDTTDARLTDARTPTAHAGSHNAGGSDPVSIDDSQVVTTITPVNWAPQPGLNDTLEAIDDAFGSLLLDVTFNTDSRLTNAREWTADTVSQAEAEAGTATTRRAFSALRVFQAVAAWWAASAAKTKLDGIATGATANQTDAHLLSRANHTGTQAASTVSGLAAVATSGAYADLSGTPSAYSLPNATASTLGGVVVGAGLSVSSGTVSANVTSVAGRTGAVTIAAADVSGLSTVATSGSAADLSGTLAIGRIPTGTTSSTVCIGNDARLTDPRTPTGSAGGSLSGTYPNPGIAAGAVGTSQLSDGSVTDAKIATSGLSTSSLNWAAIAAWAPSTAYAKGDLVSFQGIAYRRSAAGTSGSTFNTANWQQITPSEFVASQITSGTLATARLGSGTADSSTFLRGDGQWATVISTTIDGGSATTFDGGVVDGGSATTV